MFDRFQNTFLSSEKLLKTSLFLFSVMKLGLLLLFWFLCGFVSLEKIPNEAKDEPTVDDEVDNDAPELDTERDDAVSDEEDNSASDLDGESDEAVGDDSKNEGSLDENNSNPEQFDSEDEENDVAENVQDQGEEESKLEDPAPWRPKRFCEILALILNWLTFVLFLKSEEILECIFQRKRDCEATKLEINNLGYNILGSFQRFSTSSI